MPRLNPSPPVFELDGVTITERDVRRFWAKVQRRGPLECWPWSGKPNKNGYGRLHVGGAKAGRHIIAPRLALSISKGEPLARDVEARHSCDTPICCNASHLSPGTHRENMMDRDSRGRVASGANHGTATKPETRARGERHGGCRLTELQVLDIRTRYAAGGVSYGDLAAIFPASPGTIRDVVKRRRWQHI